MAANQPEPPVSAPSDLDQDYQLLRKEILAEMPERWRSCLYHPAWTAAAALLLLGVILLHLTYRGDPTKPRREPPASRPPITSVREARDRLPPSRPALNAEAGRAAEPVAPALTEASVFLSEIRAGENQAAREAEIIFLAAPPAPPELIRRPQPIDTGKLALDLAALAGLQIGGGDWDDAEQTVGMLGKYAPDKAAELSALLAAIRSAGPAPEIQVSSTKAPEDPLPDPPAEEIIAPPISENAFPASQAPNPPEPAAKEPPAIPEEPTLTEEKRLTETYSLAAIPAVKAEPAAEAAVVTVKEALAITE